MKTIFVIKERYQDSDSDGAYHWVSEQFIAVCATYKSAIEHIELLHEQEYKRAVKGWLDNNGSYAEPIENHDNQIHLTQEFNGRGGKLDEQYFIEEDELITSESNTCLSCCGDLMEDCGCDNPI